MTEQDPGTPVAGPNVDPADFSPALKAMGKAIASHPQPPVAAFCGLKLYCEALASGRVTPQEFVMDTGRPATGEEKETAVKIPVLSISGRIVISFDPTLPPEGFRIAP